MLFGSQLFTPEFGIGEPAVSVAQALREPDFAATWQSVHHAGHLASWLAFAALCCGDSARRHPPSLQNKNLPASAVLHRARQPPPTVCFAKIKDAVEFSHRGNICIFHSAFHFLDMHLIYRPDTGR